MNNNLLSNKTIVITGGTKGVGKELVLGLAKKGANIIFCGLDTKAGQEIMNESKKQNLNVRFITMDLSDVSNIKMLFDVAEKEYSKVDGFISYAGITPFGSLTDCDEDTFDKVFDINFKATFFVCFYAIQSMRKNGGGSIVITGSPHAWGGAKDRAAYSCSKGALLVLMQHIARNYANEMIRCNYLTLGWTATESEINLRKNAGLSYDEFINYAIPLIPMKHMGETTDYTEAYAFLMSDESKYTTGSILQMTAGLFI